jgi:hypothetical protein
VGPGAWRDGGAEQGAGLRPRRVAAVVVAAATLAGLAVVGSAHELFLRPRGFFVAPGATITLPALNGTFSASENAIQRTRLTDLSRRAPGGSRTAIDRATWTTRDPRSTVRVAFDGPGTYVVGAELAPHPLTLDGKAFDAYLAEEGIRPILDRRRATGRLGTRARESYAKAAKTLIAVTDAAGHVAARAGTSAALTPLGYAAEIVPLVDPYAIGVGGTVPVRALVGGKPLAGWTVRAGGTIGTSATPIPVQDLTTDADGRVDVRLTHDGHWFVAFVHMRDGTNAEGVDYVSRWATLTFGVLPAGAR